MNSLSYNKQMQGPTEQEVPVCSPSFPGSFAVRKADIYDLPAAKKLADQHKQELGFINQAALRRAIEAQSLLVATQASTDIEEQLLGLVYFHVRRDHCVTLYSIVVSPTFRRCGIGRQLFSALQQEAWARGKTAIRLKCPIELPANQFYKDLDLQIEAVEAGKHRPLNIWVCIRTEEEKHDFYC